MTSSSRDRAIKRMVEAAIEQGHGRYVSDRTVLRQIASTVAKAERRSGQVTAERHDERVKK